MILIKLVDLVPTLVDTSSISIINIATAFVLFLLVSCSLYILPAYGDGLIQDQISASAGERKLVYLSK